jgi:hypothetical protein
MTVISAPKAEPAKPVSKTRYMVVINVSNPDSSMRQFIAKEAPDKIVSKSGSNYAVGMFTERSEADALLTALVEAYPTLEMGITETEME